MKNSVIFESRENESFILRLMTSKLIKLFKKIWLILWHPILIWIKAVEGGGTLMMGKYWKRRMDSVLAEYKKWRIYYKSHNSSNQSSQLGGFCKHSKVTNQVWVRDAKGSFKMERLTQNLEVNPSIPDNSIYNSE